MTASSLGAATRRRLVQANKHLLEALRDDRATSVLEMAVRTGGFESLVGHAHCLIVTFRKDGQPVVQPVWPGLDGDVAYIWTEVNAMKAKRLRSNAAALLAPCSFRGRPLGSPIAAVGRVLDDEGERHHAAAVLAESWGWKRKTFAWVSKPLTDVHYLELVPSHTELRGETA